MNLIEAIQTEDKQTGLDVEARYDVITTAISDELQCDLQSQIDRATLQDRFTAIQVDALSKAADAGEDVLAVVAHGLGISQGTC